MFIIYKVTAPSSRIYVGVTSKSLLIRQREHFKLAKSGSRCAIHHAIRKYGDFLKWETITTAEDKETAFALEQHFIAQFDSFKNGYNLTLGGDGAIGYKFSKEDRRKLSKSLSGRKISDETKLKMSGRTGARSHRFAGPICTPFGRYESFDAAATELKINKGTLSTRCHSKSSTWKLWYLERNPK